MYMGISWILCEYEVYGVVRYKYDMPGLPPSVRPSSLGSVVVQCSEFRDEVGVRVGERREVRGVEETGWVVRGRRGVGAWIVVFVVVAVRVVCVSRRG